MEMLDLWFITLEVGGSQFWLVIFNSYRLKTMSINKLNKEILDFRVFDHGPYTKNKKFGKLRVFFKT